MGARLFAKSGTTIPHPVIIRLPAVLFFRGRGFLDDFAIRRFGFDLGGTRRKKRGRKDAGEGSYESIFSHAFGSV